MMRSIKMDWAEALRHLGGRLSTPETDEQARQMLDTALFQYPRTREGVPVYCTACRATHLAARRGTHGQEGTCALCGARGVQLDTGRGRSSRCAEELYTVYRKSAPDPAVICGVTYWVMRDDSVPDPRSEAVRVQPVQVTVYAYGRGAARFARNVSWWFCGKGCTYHKWLRGGYALSDSFSWMTLVRPVGINTWTAWGCSRDADWNSLEAAIRGTVFERAWSDDAYSGVDNAETLLAMLARYPCCEYLAKLGLGRVIAQQADGRGEMDAGGYRAVNWRGRSLEAVLGMSRAELREAQRAGVRITGSWLLRHHILRKAGSKAPVSEMDALYARMPSLAHVLADAAREAREAGQSMDQLARYMLRQPRGVDARTVLDYWRELLVLGEDMTDARRVYPRDLLASHRQTSQRVKILADQKQEVLVQRRLPKLQAQYGFAAAGLVMRPFDSCREVIAEGTALQHCVGSYAERYAEGKTNLCCLRDASAPDTPLFTVEFSAQTGRMVQCRGYQNGTPPERKEQLAAFWTAWAEAHKKGRKSA